MISFRPSLLTVVLGLASCWEAVSAERHVQRRTRRGNGNGNGNGSDNGSQGKGRSKGKSKPSCFADLMLSATSVNFGAVRDIEGDQLLGPGLTAEAHFDIGWSFSELTLDGDVVGTQTFVQRDPGTESLGLTYRFPPVVQGVITLNDPVSGCEGKLMYIGEQTEVGLGEFVISGGTGDFFGASGTIMAGAFDAGSIPIEIAFA